jgi:hypothetical protein
MAMTTPLRCEVMIRHGLVVDGTGSTRRMADVAIDGKRIDEGIDRPNRIDLIDEVIEAFGQQRRLPTVRTFNEALHPYPRKSQRES